MDTGCDAAPNNDCDDVIEIAIDEKYHEITHYNKQMMTSTLISYTFILPPHVVENIFLHSVGNVLLGISVYYIVKIIKNHFMIKRLKEFRSL